MPPPRVRSGPAPRRPLQPTHQYKVWLICHTKCTQSLVAGNVGPAPACQLSYITARSRRDKGAATNRPAPAAMRRLGIGWPPQMCRMILAANTTTNTPQSYLLGCRGTAVGQMAEMRAASSTGSWNQCVGNAHVSAYPFCALRYHMLNMGCPILGWEARTTCE